MIGALNGDRPFTFTFFCSAKTEFGLSGPYKVRDIGQIRTNLTDTLQDLKIPIYFSDFHPMLAQNTYYQCGFDFQFPMHGCRKSPPNLKHLVRDQNFS